MALHFVVGSSSSAAGLRRRRQERRFGRRGPVVGIGLTCLVLSASAGGQSTASNPVSAMSLEELANVEVTTVSRKAELLLESPAAVYVITSEDIRRSGVTTIVEALRLAPGVEVARINSNQWAVGIRGFESRLSRSVLVLIDGRSVYTPLFAGVYWEVQDTLLEDVDRIEVIRGPGGTLWGANAVNGIINILTKKASETQGGLVSAASGNEDRLLAGARYGGSLGGRASYRVYGKYSDRDSAFHPDRLDFDAWHMAQGGFRVDATTESSDAVTLQGDAYSSRDGTRAMPSSFTAPFLTTVDAKERLSGGNLLGRWSRTTAGGSEAQVQAYYDNTHHDETIFEENRNTLDFDFQDRLHLGPHEITGGLGFRWSVSDATSISTITISPERRTDRLYSAFVQDEVPLVDGRLRLTVGTKIEHNDYTGFEVQPTGRLLWTPGTGHYVWAAVSRAVRTPSRVEFDASRSIAVSPTFPLFGRLTGDGNFVSEKVLAYEAGYRVRLGARTSLDLAAFYDDLSDLTSGEPAGPPFAEGEGAGTRIIVPFVFRNGLEGRDRGAELAADTALTEWLTVRASYSYLSLDMRPSPGSADKVSGPSIEGSSPHHLVSVAGHATFPPAFEADAILRYASRLPAQKVGAAANLDLRVGWRASSAFEVSLVGQGLFRPRQLEFGGGESTDVQIQRAFYGKATWRF